MNLSLILALISLIPQPQKVVEGIGTTKDLSVRHERDENIPAEGYRIRIDKNGVVVWSSDDAGRFYAATTLAQLREKKGGRDVYPYVEIEDAPRFRWRGLHFDDCRHFFGKETLKKTLDVMAQFKFNRLHWHLTEDQGWRLDIPGYPELVKYGAVRSQSVRHGEAAWKGTKEDADKLDGTKYGPFYYTEADVREIIAYAGARHIQIVPEIELPGHVYAALAAYPELACVPANLSSREPRLVWGIEKDVLCLGNDKAVKFMEDVLDYVCRLFPGDVVHIGGDECPQERWKTCPKCQARITAENLGDEHGLQPWVTRHFVKFLEARGKRALGWDEYLLGDVPKSAIGMSWRESRSGAGHELVSGAAAATRGHDVVMTPCSYCYLDYGQGLAEDPFQYIGGKVTLARCYSFDPCAGVPAEARSHILGGQGNNWSEYTWNEYDLEWKMWPRACALAEVFWTGEGRPGFFDFRNRMSLARRRLLAAGVNCAPLGELPPPERVPVANSNAFTIATFNMRCPSGHDKGENRWYRRLPRIVDVIRHNRFDVFGVQEVTPGELDILTLELPHFRHVGCGRNAARLDEGMYIFYATNRFACVESDTFWLSETPDVPGSIYKGAGCPRTCTWAVLKDLRTGKSFRYFNTHLDHISSQARWDGMQVLLNRGVRPAKARGETVFLTGDLNETLDEVDDPGSLVRMAGPKLSESAKNNPIALVSTELVDTYGASETPHAGTYRTFHGFRGTPSCRLDYIYATKNVRVLAHKTLNDRPDGEYASDHYPVSAKVEIR